MSELETLLVTQARKANPDLHRRTDGEILQMFRDNEMPDGQTEDSAGILKMIPQNISLNNNTIPQYRIRDQLKRDFIEGGILKDAYEGLGETYNQIRQTPLGQGIGSIKNFATNIADKGIDLGKKGIDLGKIAVSGIGNMIAPGLGFVLSKLPQDSARNKFNRSFNVGGSNMPNDPYGYYNDLRAGNLNQDPFGRNTVSMFGNYMGTLAKDANYTGTNKFNLAKKDYAQNFLNKNAINSGGVKIDNTVYSGADYQGGSGDGGNNQTSGPAPQRDYSRHSAYGLRRGGIASL